MNCKRLRWVLLACLAVSFAHGQTKFDLSYAKGTLGVSHITPGVAGQCLTTDGGGNTAWGICAGGGGSGTVTSFSAGTLSPLFTTSVTNPTTTPSLAFVLSNVAAHRFFGNNTGSSAAPAFVQPSSTELADFSATPPSSAGKIPIYDPAATNSAGGTGAYVPGDPLVQGLFADGSTSAENPVAIGGYDTAGAPALHRATALNGNPAGTEYGLVTRNIPSGTQTVGGSVSVSNFPATQPISAASLPLPTGAAQDSTLTGGTTKAINRGGAKGSTAAADVTSTASGANHQGLDVALYDASGNQLGLSGTPVRTDPTGTTTQPVSGTLTANIGTTNGLALDASVTGLEVAQASTTSGQKGILGQGAVTTNAPSYTTAQTDPLSLDTSGNLRVSLKDTPSNTNNINVAVQSAPANQSVNVAQINGVTPLMGNGTTGTGSHRVTVASDNSNSPGIGGSATGSAVPSAARYIGGTDGANLVGYFVDPCQRGAKSFSPVNIVTATTVRFAAPAASKKTYVCSVVLVAAAADNVNFIEGTGGTCGTGTAGVTGGTTAATGFNLAANGGLTLGNGQGAVMATAGTNVDMCLITSAGVQLSGHITWVQF